MGFSRQNSEGRFSSFHLLFVGLGSAGGKKKNKKRRLCALTYSGRSRDSARRGYYNMADSVSVFSTRGKGRSTRIFDEHQSTRGICFSKFKPVYGPSPRLQLGNGDAVPWR